MFKLISKYKPAGDQPEAIDKLVKGINEGKKGERIVYQGDVNYVNKK